jgi:CheY-like chemotaxis protein
VSQPSHPVVVDADVTRLAQVFMNLLNNAAKYSEPGGHIWLTVESDGSDVVVSVKDTGIGIDADYLPRIFEMFTQVDRSLEKSQGGLGIGLTLVGRLVEMHGGKVEAKSEGPGRGSEFVVRLPVVVGASALPPVEQAEPKAQKSAFRILIVDDNVDGADSLAVMLNILGNDTRTAYDGQTGVQEAERFRPDVALFDIGLPKLNGYEACQRIRKQPWGKGVVLIAVTGWGQEDDRRRSQEAGFDYHMVKPVDPQALMKLLAEPETFKR